ncbi:hypothetical protein LEMLEM_LOCUS8059, partial [Lemmus lemmus]
MFLWRLNGVLSECVSVTGAQPPGVKDTNASEPWERQSLPLLQDASCQTCDVSSETGNATSSKPRSKQTPSKGFRGK